MQQQLEKARAADNPIMRPAINQLVNENISSWSTILKSLVLKMKVLFFKVCLNPNNTLIKTSTLCLRLTHYSKDFSRGLSNFIFLIFKNLDQTLHKKIQFGKMLERNSVLFYNFDCLDDNESFHKNNDDNSCIIGYFNQVQERFYKRKHLRHLLLIFTLHKSDPSEFRMFWLEKWTGLNVRASLTSS